MQKKLASAVFPIFQSPGGSSEWKKNNNGGKAWLLRVGVKIKKCQGAQKKSKKWHINYLVK